MSRKTAIVFFGIIATGAVISLVTLLGPQSKQPTSKAEPPVAEKEIMDSATEPKSAADKAEMVEKEAKSQEKPEQTALPKGTFPTPAAAMSALADVLSGKNFEAFEKAVGSEAIAPSERVPIQKLIENPDWKLDPETPHSEVSKAVNSARWAMNFVKDSREEREKEKPAEGTLTAPVISTETKVGGAEQQDRTASGETKPVETTPSERGTPNSPNSPNSPNPPIATDGTSAPAVVENPTMSPATKSGKASESTPSSQLYVDLREQQPGAFRIAKVTIPLSTEPGKSGSDTTSDDALTVAQAFSDAVMRHDYAAARALSDPGTVTDERVAALMIAIEEGNFTLKKQRPFVVTLSRDDVTWVLAQVASAAASSEYAIELNHSDGKWLVGGLTFSKMLSTLSEMAGGGGIAYTPIIENPEGGDSLVLYFEFDNSNITQRTGRQLDIIAKILKQNEKRLIHITGHADALGSDPYNDELSEQRAEVIRHALIERGVNAHQVVTKAFGSAKPRMPNFKPDGSDNPSGRSLNRRAEVYLDF